MARAVLARLIWFACLLGCYLPAVSVRQDQTLQGPALGRSVGCVEFEKFGGKDGWGKNIPEHIYLILQARNLLEEYQTLTMALARAQKGTLKAWKASALYRTMYIGGHEQTFEAKGVSLVLTKELSDQLSPWSLIKLCFIDRNKAPDTKLKHVYHDVPQVKGPGIFIAPYEDYLDADKSTMPVDLLKYLESKDLMQEHIDMAGLINIGVRTSPLAVGTVVRRFKEQFEAKKCLVYFVPNYKSGKHVVEYVDLDRYDGNIANLPTTHMTVNGAVDADFYVTAHEKCMNWDYDNGGQKNDNIRVWAKLVQWKAGAYMCDVVAGSSSGESRTKGCKCPKGTSVYCGPTKIGNRKFRITELKMQMQSHCLKGVGAYCAPAPCKLPSW